MRWSAFLLVLFISGVCAETIVGKVIKIADGDTLTHPRCYEHEYKIRLASIGAPERKQANYETSRQSLAKLAFGKMVLVDWHKRDRYGRLVKGRGRQKGRWAG